MDDEPNIEAGRQLIRMVEKHSYDAHAYMESLRAELTRLRAIEAQVVRVPIVGTLDNTTRLRP